MAIVLVVDDSAMQRHLATNLLKQLADIELIEANAGKAAIAMIERHRPDVVLTDLQMPGMNGLELVDYVRKHHPSVPVVLMTAFGSEDIAIEALRRGAASYVSKRRMATDLTDTVRSLLGVVRCQRDTQRVMDQITERESHFEIENDLSLVGPLVDHIEAGLARLNLCDETDLIRVAVALREALANAIDHGNLELRSELRATDPSAYYRLRDERRRAEPYAARRVHVAVRETRTEARFVVHDEGRGFDPSILPDATDPANLEREYGRGLLLIRTFMDTVHHDDGGRQITMVKCVEPGLQSNR
jgi:DNA-binding NarL/FixJ family response regulator